ncbi:MAG: EF-P beta-lysylation protein EpmB, partial [Pirellulaceae bacterium]|nr:EF-P beta-lysylation protein EpmB [Pirellulaceae bacterium]
PYVVIHANHAQEIDERVENSLKKMIQSGIVVLNQSVFLRGINDNFQALYDLSERLINIGVVPYYLHQLDRTQGVAHYESQVSIGKELIEKLRDHLPGYAVPRFAVEEPGKGSKTILA